MDRDHGAAAARLRIAIFPYQRNFLVEKLTELQRSLGLTPAASPTLSVLSSESPCGSSDRKATFADAHSNSLRSLLEALPKSTIWRAGLMRKFPSFSWDGTYRSVLSCESPCGSSDRKATFAGAHSNSLRSLLEALPKSTIWRAGLMRKFPSFSWDGTYRSVLSCESPCGSSDRKATFADAHSCGFAYA